MGTTRFSGPILGSSEAMAGALEDAPIGAVANTQWVEYFNDFSLQIQPLLHRHLQPLGDGRLLTSILSFSQYAIVLQ